MFKNPYTIATDTDQLDKLKKLQAGQSFKELLTDAGTGKLVLGNLELDAEGVADSLDGTFEAPKSVGAMIATQERLEKIMALNNKRLEALNKSVQTKARKLLVSSPTTKVELQLAELREKASQLDVFNNPLGKPAEVVRLRNADGDNFQVRLYGSAITNVLPGETPDSARARLAGLIINDTKLLLGLMGLKVTAAHEAAVRHSPMNYRGELPEGQVGVLAGYSITFSDAAKLIRSVNNLLEANTSVHTIDPTRADSATLRLNMTQEEALTDMEQEDTDTGTELEDITQAI